MSVGRAVTLPTSTSNQKGSGSRRKEQGTMTFPFLELPPEIREKIYLLTCTSPQHIPITDDIRPFLNAHLSLLLSRHIFPHALLLTCHQIYHEVRPLYFAHNSFSLLLVRDPSPLAYFVDPSFRDNRRRIKSFRLIFSRWGRHDFFLREFAPVLSDMILNGCLKNLEVWMREVHTAHFLQSRRMGTKARFGHFEALEKLLEILKDPYLDKVSLKAYWIVETHPARHYFNRREDMSKSIEFQDVQKEPAGIIYVNPGCFVDSIQFQGQDLGHSITHYPLFYSSLVALQ